MLPLKKILWPTDFSDPSLEALKSAQELALHFSAELYAVHVIAPIPVVAIPPGPTGFNVGLYQGELERAAKKSLREIRDRRIAPEEKE
jgi:nucleotide-binding universal stress UspA family protein